MRQKKHSLLSSFLAISLVATASSYGATLLAVDFGSASSPVESGFVGQSGGSATHTTTAGDITVAFTGQQGFFDYAPPNTTGSNTDLYRDFIFKNNGTMTMTLSGPGISASTDYYLSFWTQYQQEARNTTFTATAGTTGATLGPIATTNAAATGLSDPNHFISGSFTSNSSGVLTITVAGTTNRPALNAIQIDAVPEPSGTFLLGIGGLALILRRRK